MNAEMISIKKTKSFLLEFLLFFINIYYSNSFPPDKITSLPGLNYDTNFNQFAGWLNVNDNENIFYW